MKIQEFDFACDLTVLNATERSQFALDTKALLDEVQETREMENGFALKLHNGSGQIIKIENFIKRERQCCSFLHFQLELDSEAEMIWLKITGEAGTKKFLQSELDQLLSPINS